MCIAIDDLISPYPPPHLAVCSEVPSLDNGLVSYDTSDFPLPLDTVVTYSCNLGYALNGSVNRTCMFVNDSATFEPEPPLCDRTLINIIMQQLNFCMYMYFFII